MSTVYYEGNLRIAESKLNRNVRISHRWLFAVLVGSNLPLVGQLLIVLVTIAGCERSSPQQDSAPSQRSTARAKSVDEYISDWDDMGMWLPDSEQIEVFRAQFESAHGPLRDALSHSDDSVRMRAAYVIGEIGSQARPAGEDLLARLPQEPDATVRMYIIDALNVIGYQTTATVDALTKRYDALDGSNVPPTADHSYPEVDEKITVASALYMMVEPQSKSEYYNFVTKWLDHPDVRMDDILLERYWERRWMAVNVLERMPGATDAIPKLKALQNEANAKPWVDVHVPRVLEALRRHAQ